MLHVIGVADVESLFASIPEGARVRHGFDLPQPLSEMELGRRLHDLAARNHAVGDRPSFLGAGAYHHFVPAVVDHLLLRGEFLTAYTPYQAEFSQGTLQAIFEFQTLIAQLTEMDVANASLYDGATALAESMLMAQRIKRRGTILLSSGIHPHYREVVRTLAQHAELAIREVGIDASGRTDAEAVGQAADDDVAAVAIQSPNFFGCVEDLEALGGVVQQSGALFVVTVAEALSLGLLAGPGHFGADIVVGEGQSLGLPLSHGGPYLGLMATRERYLRQMPGRLAGEARDSEGRRGYALTLSTREQHIRRERATSNICTNQGLCALAATIYMALMGKTGLREVAQRNLDLAAHARALLGGLDGFSLAYSAPTFNEFVLRLPGDAEAYGRWLASQGILGGLPLGRYYPDLHDCMLFCITEMNGKADVEKLAGALEEGAGGGVA
jgi:glycine dehydrogenase subunit 1